ncbi:MAG: type VI secretion system tip protein TssI/VgrG [Byssovorax sp.]
MSLLEIKTAGSPPLDVRFFSVREAISSPFEVTVKALSPDPSLDLAAITGEPAAFRIASGLAFALEGGARQWSGTCRSARQLQAETTGLSTYEFVIVPTLWCIGQRRNHRIFQHLSIPDILDTLLDGWTIERAWAIDRAAYPKLEYKVQYGESDLSFFHRLLEEAGLAFTFSEHEGSLSKLVIGDALHRADPRPSPPIPYVDHPNQSAEQEYLTEVRFSREVRPGAAMIADYDLRRPRLSVHGTALKGAPPEDHYEQFHYRPGALLVEGGKGGGTPVADDKGIARHEEHYGNRSARLELEGTRMGREGITFHTNAADLRPGTVFSMGSHPHPRLAEGARLLVTDFTLSGSPLTAWSMQGHAVRADTPFRMPRRTHKPQIKSLQSAIVVGPAGQEIHTDEFGRVRVQFHWDRAGKADENSSSWIRVSQGWGGRGYGMQLLPRIGQEVLVSFLDGNPDQPVIVGRLFNQTNPVPYKLPDHKTVSTWKSDSSQGSAGFNEIKFEDKKGDELFYQQAEKNQRTLVKHNETITVLHNRDKDVKHDELETTGLVRVEVTGLVRTEKTGKDRLTIIGVHRQKLVLGSEVERTEKDRKERVGKDKSSVVKKVRRVRVERDSHVEVRGSRRQKIGKSQSLTVGEDQQEVVKGRYALKTGKEIHLKAGTEMVGEGADVTLKGPGGFIRIDASGVTIRGKIVKINVSGSPGKGSGSNPLLPDEAKEPGKLDKFLTRSGFDPAKALSKFKAPIGAASLSSLLKGGASFLPISVSSFGVTLTGNSLASKIIGGIVSAAIVAATVSPAVKKLFKDIGKYVLYAVEGGLYYLFTGGWSAMEATECPKEGATPGTKTVDLSKAEEAGLAAAKPGTDVTAHVKPLLEQFKPTIHQDPNDAFPLSIETLLEHSTLRYMDSSAQVAPGHLSVSEYRKILYGGGAPAYGQGGASMLYFLDIDSAFAHERGGSIGTVYGRAIKVAKDQLQLQYTMIRAGSYLPHPPDPYAFFEHGGDGESPSIYIRRLPPKDPSDPAPPPAEPPPPAEGEQAPPAPPSKEWTLYKTDCGGHDKRIICCARCGGASSDGTPHVYVAKGSHATAPSPDRRKTKAFAIDVFDESVLTYELLTPEVGTEEHDVVFTARTMWGNPHHFEENGAMLGTNPYGGYEEIGAATRDNPEEAEVWSANEDCKC